MRSGQNREIGFLINQIANPFNAEVISGVCDLLEADGYLVSVLDGRDDADRQSQQLEAFIRNGRGGLLWVPATDTQDTVVSMLRNYRMPVVTFMRRLDHAGFDHVGTRNAEATEMATRYLAEIGHKKIAYLGGTDMTSVRQDRILGYTNAVGALGLGAPIVWGSLDNKIAGRDALRALLAKHPDTTAVVCNGDMVALGACLALIDDGMVPGREVSVIGFDDIQDAAVATPPLTTLAVSPYQMGRKLARILLDRIRDPEEPVTVAEVSAELVIRSTTGAPVLDA